MTDHRPRIYLSPLISTTQLLKQANSVLYSNRCIFLFLAFLLFSFRTLVEYGTHNLTAFIDRDPNLRTLLSRIDLSGHHHQRTHNPRQSPNQDHNLRRRKPFLHLTRGGTLDDDFFSGEDDRNRPSFSSFNRHLTLNHTSVLLSSFNHAKGFPSHPPFNGLILPKIIRSGIQFKIEDELETEESPTQITDKEDGEMVDLQFLIKGLELGHRDAATLFFLVSFLSAAYGWVILGFTILYSFILGTIFIVVINEFLGILNSFFSNALEGIKVGIKRLSGFVLMRWALRDAITQVLGLWFFGDIEDQYSVFKLFVRLKLMPFSIISSWVPGFESQIAGFELAWFVADTAVTLVLAVDAWVTVVDPRRTGREIVKEGCYMVLVLINQSITLKFLEAVLCGPMANWALVRLLGRPYTTLFQAFAEVYFMVAWLFFYFSARLKAAHMERRIFGVRDFEQMANGLR